LEIAESTEATSSLVQCMVSNGVGLRLDLLLPEFSISDVEGVFNVKPCLCDFELHYNSITIVLPRNI